MAPKHISLIRTYLILQDSHGCWNDTVPSEGISFAQLGPLTPLLVVSNHGHSVGWCCGAGRGWWHCCTNFLEVNSFLVGWWRRECVGIMVTPQGKFPLRLVHQKSTTSPRKTVFYLHFIQYFWDLWGAFLGDQLKWKISTQNFIWFPKPCDLWCSKSGTLQLQLIWTCGLWNMFCWIPQTLSTKHLIPSLLWT